MEAARGLFRFSSAIPSGIDIATGFAYYNLAADHLRVQRNGFFYYDQGTPNTLIEMPAEDFDALPFQAGFYGQLLYYNINDSTSPATVRLWPIGNTGYTLNIRYIRLMPDIATPEASLVVPWFPEQEYLIKELSAELMALTSDSRMAEFKAMAMDILRRWLISQRDDASYAQTVSLDRRRFGSGSGRLKNTKAIGGF